MAPQQQQRLNLFDYSEEDLLGEESGKSGHANNKTQALTYYEILGLDVWATQDEVKRAYRKTSLRYHPDKTRRGDDDYVFLAVKRAYDTLFDSDKRKAYDSTVLPFDEDIPQSRATMMADPLLLYKDEDFYETFGKCFQNNLRFDARLRPDLQNYSKNNKRLSKSNNEKIKPPHIGDENTPIEEVNAFYDYWIHFESWRDFSAQSAEELQVENELENAESRFEKRWIQKEIDKRSKQLKRQEMARIQTLVERAMEADPRLRRQKQLEKELKQQKILEKQRQEELKKQQEEEERRKEQERLEQEAKERAQEKLEREEQKKKLRKAKQQLRRMTSASFEELNPTPKPDSVGPWNDAYDMQQDIEVLCTSLTYAELVTLNEKFEQEKEVSSCHKAALTLIHKHVLETKENQRREQEELAEKQKKSVTEKAGASESDMAKQQNQSWTKDELSALAKAVKKYPPGGASRWEQIANFVNNLCKQQDPRTKEECIEKYNQIARNASASTPATSGSTSKSPSDASAPIDDTTPNASTGTGWTAEQDQQLQDGLAKYPASMDKNERWTKISKCVEGKSKKDCVQRFKAIREALMQNRKP